jgi:acetyltransferase
LKTAGFDGSIQLVNPNYSEIEGISAVGSVAELSPILDLLIIAVPPAAIPDVVLSAAAEGCPRCDCHYVWIGSGASEIR